MTFYPFLFWKSFAEIIVGRGFLTAPFLRNTVLFIPFSSFVVHPSSFLSCFFGWLCDCAISNVLVKLPISFLKIKDLDLLSFSIRSTLLVWFMQQGFKHWRFHTDNPYHTHRDTKMQTHTHKYKWTSPRLSVLHWRNTSLILKIYFV